jgi:PPOX class probable F420-dependent enzyme
MAIAGLTDAVRAFLAEPRYAVIATINPSGMPQQTPIWYEVQGDEVLLNTAAGRLKERNLRRDPRLSLCIVDGERYVTLYGRATLIDDRDQTQADIKRLAIRYHGPQHGEQQAANFARQQRVTIRMPISHAHVRGFEG